MNVADRLTEHARNQPDHPAIEDGERIVRYGELDGLVNDACANLQGLGIEAGDMVLVMLPDSADHLIIICALLRAGAVILSLSDRLPDVELERNIKMLPVKAMIASSGRFPLAGVPLLDLSNICCKAAGPFNAPDTSEGDPALLLQSSGTTGVPKSILRSHSQALVWIHRWMMINCWVSTDRSLNLTPMSFNTGRDVCLGILHVGATVVINHSHSLDNLVDFVRNKGITYLKLAPSHLGPLLDYPVDKPPLFPDVRAMVVSSAPTTHAQRLLARQRLTLNTFEYMGATESGPLVYATPTDQDAYPDSVGRVVEGVVAEIVDGDGKPVPAGEVGLVRYRGP
ncbi:MAG: long-chain fatty acid--CoA ligase, partial [Rhodospirillales bacterium]|nr:long-chain fatty acid--CoA ligase [Rhodospirillales bacterium]